MNVKWQIIKSNATYMVYELATEHTLYEGDWKNCAALIGKMKKGVGFDGFTPLFMVRDPREQGSPDFRDSSPEA